MASDKASMASISTEDSKSSLPPTVLTLGSTTNTQIIHLPATAPRNFFTGRNLYHWRRFVERVLRPRKLDGHLINPRPNDTDTHYLRWLDEEDVIFTWLLDSMKPEVSERFIDLDSVKDVWDTVIRLYSKIEDESRIAELNKKAMDLLQEQRTVLEFANALNALWSELDFYRPLPTDSTAREYILKGRTHCFLTGLRPEFETMRSILFNREQPLSFDESVVQVIREETRLKALSTTPVSHSAESQAFILKNPGSTHGQPPNQQIPNIKPTFNQPSYPRNKQPKRKGDNKDNLWCDFCQRYRHTRETCWRLNGHPIISQSHVMYHPHPSSGQGYSTPVQPPITSTDIQLRGKADKSEVDLLKEKIQELTALISKSTSIIGSTLVANSGKHFILSKIFSIISPQSTVHKNHHTSWILDSGATDHMTPIADLFTSYTPCSTNKNVQTADGTLLAVSGIGTLNLDPIGKLEHVLHVPQLFISLVSVQKLASIQPYKIEFDGLNAFLCNKVQQWKIGLAKVHDGLYYLPAAKNSQALSRSMSYDIPQSNALATIGPRRGQENLWLIHQRLGHPLFQILKHMFPDVFQGISIDKLICDVCAKAKHKKHSYKSHHSERRKHPFSLFTVMYGVLLRPQIFMVLNGS